MDSTLGFLKHVIADDNISDVMAGVCEKIDQFRREDTSVTVTVDESDIILSFPSSYDELSEKRTAFDGLLTAGAPLHVTRLGDGKVMIDVFISNERADEDEL